MGRLGSLPSRRRGLATRGGAQQHLSRVQRRGLFYELASPPGILICFFSVFVLARRPQAVVIPEDEQEDLTDWNEL